MSPDAGRAVAGQLRAQGGEEVRRAALAHEGERGGLDGLRRTIGAGRIATPERAADAPVHEAKQAETRALIRRLRCRASPRPEGALPMTERKTARTGPKPEDKAGEDAAKDDAPAQGVSRDGTG